MVIAEVAHKDVVWQPGSIIPQLEYIKGSPWVVTSSYKNIQQHLTSGPESLVGFIESFYGADYQRPALDYKIRHLNKCYDAVCFSEGNSRLLEICYINTLKKSKITNSLFFFITLSYDRIKFKGYYYKKL